MAENVPRLGRLITGPAERDAVHIAVVPAMAGIHMTPGTHVGVCAGEPMIAAPSGKYISDYVGIVDPFLKENLKKGDMFYIYLYPGTVISLRHHYRHPVLDAEEIRQETMESLKHPAVERMKAWAKQFGTTYGETMRNTRFFLLTGKEITLDGIASLNVSTEEYPDGGTFWGDYETITNQKVPDEKKKDFFSCEC